MANLNQPPSRVTPNLLHILNAFTDSSNTIINTIVELNSNTINKYELITETGHLKLDRVGYSSLAYPFAYGCIPRTWDEDGDPLDKRMDHISSYEDLGDHWLKETKYYWEHYKDLKKPGTCTVNGFFGIEEAVKVIKDCEERYKKEIDPKLVN